MPENASPDPLLNVQQLADLLGLSRVTTYREYRRLGIPFLTVGGSVRFRRESVEEWIRAREAKESAA